MKFKFPILVLALGFFFFFSCSTNDSLSESDKQKIEIERQAQEKAKQDSLNHLRQIQIQEGLIKNAWYNSKDKQEYFVFSFNDTAIFFTNSKGSIPYSLTVDTLRFQDDSKSTYLVEFDKNGNLTLKNIATNLISSLTIASQQDKYIGSWSGQIKNLRMNLFKLNLKPGGKGVLTQADGSYAVSYGVIKNQLKMNLKNNYFTYYLNENNLNTMTEANSIWSRNLKSTPKNLALLF